MKVLKSVLCASLIFASSLYASDRVGNGGHAVQMGDKMYLLDLVEAGAEESKSFATVFEDGFLDHFNQKTPGSSEQMNANLRFYHRYDYVLEELVFDDEAFKTRFFIILSEFPTVMREMLLSVMRLYTWKIVNVPLNQLKDIQSPIDLSQLTVYQAAIRHDTSILINKNVWDKMDTLNRVALVLHEIVYSLVKPQKTSGGFYEQDSWSARQIVGNFFSDPWSGRNLFDYKRNGTPVLDMFSEEMIKQGYMDYFEVISFFPAMAGKTEIYYGPMLQYEDRDMNRYFNWMSATSVILKSEEYIKQGFGSCYQFVRSSPTKLAVNFKMSMPEMKDYQTETGFQKSVRFSHKDVKYSMMGGSNTKSYPGIITVSYKTVDECKNKLLKDIQPMLEGLRQRYDAQEFL